MALALDQLGRAAVGPDRLADPAHRAPGAAFFVDELLPGGDDARRVAPSSAMSANTTQSASSPSQVRSSSIFSAPIATMIGSPAVTASRMKGAAPSTKLSGLS